MEPFVKHRGIVAPLDRVNVDTDAIVPKQFLRKVERTGFGVHLFHEWRYKDYEGTVPNPDFVLNKPEYQNATVLLARDNFGCGSSREHAPWALLDYGFRVIIAPSFADIFYNNCVKNGLLLIRLKTSEVDELFNQVQERPGCSVIADLVEQTLFAPNGQKYTFDIQSFAKICLLNGLDQIGWTQQFEQQIASYEDRITHERPWMR